jgi:hypothetical protein
MIFNRKKWRGLTKNTSDGVYIARRVNMRRMLSEMKPEQVYALIYFIIDRISDEHPFDIEALENMMCEFTTFKLGMEDLKLNNTGV